jgi:hypothetical protein
MTIVFQACKYAELRVEKARQLVRETARWAAHQVETLRPQENSLAPVVFLQHLWVFAASVPAGGICACLWVTQESFPVAILNGF